MRTLGRLAIAAALIVPIGIVAAPSAQATQGTGGHFNCTASAGTLKITPGLLLNKSNNQRFQGGIPALACTGGSVTGGKWSINLTEQKLRCPKLAKGGPVNGQSHVIWNKSDKAGQSMIILNFKVTATSGHTTSGTIDGTVKSGAIAVGHAVSGTWAIDKGLNSIPNGGNCSVSKPMTSANFTSITVASV